MRYLLMMTVPLFSLRFTTLSVSRKLDRRSECDDELAEPREGGGVRLPDSLVAPPPPRPPPLPPPRPPPPPPPPPGLRLDGLKLDRERNNP